MIDEFITFTPDSKGSFEERLADLYDKLNRWMLVDGRDTSNLVCCRVFLSDFINQAEIFEASNLYKVLSQGFVSIIEQAPLDGSKITLLVCFSSSVDLKKEGNQELMTFTKNGVKHIMHSVRFTDDEAMGLTAKQQTTEAFRRHEVVLKNLGLSTKNNCVRTWIFVRDIDHNYASVVAARNGVFEEIGLKEHYIASTGIDGSGKYSKASVCMDFYSVDSPELEMKYLKASHLLNNTMEYGVAFERGTALRVNGESRIFISGTASIDNKGLCLYHGDVYKQMDRLFENIAGLLEEAESSLNRVDSFIVYVRDISERDVVEAYMRQHFASIPTVIVHAPVCRPEWLVEVECTAS